MIWQELMLKTHSHFGSTGSIVAPRRWEVIRSHTDILEVEILTAQTNDELFITQAMEFQAQCGGDR